MNEFRKLASLIRKGATYRPKATGDYFAPTRDGNWGSCVIGAAYEGSLGRPATEEEIKHALQWDNNDVVDVIQEAAGMNIRNSIARFVEWNDDDGLSREEIADMLDEMRVWVA